MRRWAILWGLPVAALLLIPAGVDAKKKTILRFDKKGETSAPAKPAAKKTPSPSEAPTPGEAPTTPSPDQGAAPGDVGGRPDWYGKKFKEQGAAPGAGEEGAALPGTPAEEETTTAPTRPAERARSLRAAPPPELPVPAPSPRTRSASKSVSVPVAPGPKLPTRPEPFTYAPVQPGTITPRGYDPSLAPRGQVRIPAPAPIVSGRSPSRPRALPRLAPYGTALPPDQTEPPAAIPR